MHASRGLGAACTQKFAPRGKAGEQAVDLHRGARLAAERPLLQRAHLYPEFCTDGFLGEARGAGHVGHRGDARQRLAAEPECGQVVQVAFGAQLAGGVAAEGQLHLVGGDPVTIVGDHDAFGATAGDFDADVLCAGVQGVFDQLFDDGGGSFDDFTRRDLGRQVRIHHVDGGAHHGLP